MDAAGSKAPAPAEAAEEETDEAYLRKHRERIEQAVVHAIGAVVSERAADPLRSFGQHILQFADAQDAAERVLANDVTGQDAARLLTAAASEAAKAAETAPCSKCGSHLAASFDAGATWSCAGCQSPMKNAARISAEQRCLSAVKKLDAERAPTISERERQLSGRAVQVGWLRSFWEALPASQRHTISTLELVLTVIKRDTALTRCRYAELPGVSTGPPTAMMSHTWLAPFANLVAAASHVLQPTDFVWIDIFVSEWLKP